MSRRVISLIRDARIQPAARHAHKDLPVCCSDAQDRPSNSQRGDGGLLNVTSQLAWQKDFNIGPSLPPVVYSHHHDDDLGRSDQGQVSRSCQFSQRCNRVLPLNSDVTDDVDRRERRHRRRKHRKSRRHRHEQQQTLVNSASPTSGHTDSVTSSLSVL